MSCKMLMCYDFTKKRLSCKVVLCLNRIDNIK
uniref:Uncharacterized protein n=1 Tax=Podoviridae sp. ctnWS46 TaxID=2827747 RepID=A0A8S5SZM6_9CAUD|nr:MAG TPA: hypothetical protein [Podoviridae sp. ctnWS46]